MPETVSWIVFAVIVGGLLSLDLFVFHRDAHAVRMREAAIWVTIWVTLGLAFGALARHTATAVGVLVGVLFVVPMLLGLLGGTWADLVSYLPSEAGQAMATVVEDPDELSPFAGFLVLAGWVGATLAAAAVVLKRRDA